MNRHERRANEAEYRKMYGKAAFLKLRKGRDEGRKIERDAMNTIDKENKSD